MHPVHVQAGLSIQSPRHLKQRHVILSRRRRHPPWPISNTMHHLFNFHQHWTRGVAVRAIQNVKIWPFNCSVPIGPISVSLLNASTQMQTVSSRKIRMTMWNITGAVRFDGCTGGQQLDSLHPYGYSQKIFLFPKYLDFSFWLIKELDFFVNTTTVPAVASFFLTDKKCECDMYSLCSCVMLKDLITWWVSWWTFWVLRAGQAQVKLMTVMIAALI